MLWFSRLAVMVGLLALVGATRAQDRILWAAGLEQAQRAATDERKLVLLHFYNDHCEPCERVEQNVFSQPQVAQAIARNYVPVKIHAGAQPKIAEHFRVDRWPTDIICTPAGQEIMRTTSPQKAEAYVGLVDQVALQTGVGAGRQWQTSMQAVGQQVLDPRVAQAQAITGQAAQGAQGAIGQAGTTLQGYGQWAQQQAGQLNQQFQQTAEQAQGAAQQWAQRADGTAQQFGNASQEMNSHLQNTRPQGASSDSAYAQFAQQPGQQQPAFAQQPAITQQMPFQEFSVQQPAFQQPTVQPGLPTSNPFLHTQLPSASAPHFVASQPLPQSAAARQPTPQQPHAQQPQMQQPQIQTSPRLANLAASSSPALSADQGLVPASQAPPIALEGYCPVTLLEVEKWKKADARFGAIHRGRTYLFASEIEQRKFLANPDGYSPVLSGFDPVIFHERGQMVEGKRGYGVKYNQQIFLFSGEGSLQVFSKTPRPFANTVRQAMIGADSGNKYR